MYGFKAGNTWGGCIGKCLYCTFQNLKKKTQKNKYIEITACIVKKLNKKKILGFLTFKKKV